MSDANSQFDLVVLGATGFVGKLVCRYLAHHAETYEDLRWAIAGRSPDKLSTLARSLGSAGKSLPQLRADVTNDATLRDLCAQTRVVISTVGPYALYGESLVKVCAETGTDYCDLTGESPWMRRMIDTYGAIAAASGAHIVHCCGFDSIPSDLGVFYLQQQARQRSGQSCERVKMRVYGAQGGVSGGTAASGINVIKEAAADSNLRQALADPYFLCPESASPDHPPPLIPVQYDAEFQSWVTPFVMAEVNTRIVLRSNALLDYAYGRHFQYDEAIVTGVGLLGWMAARGLKVGLEGFAIAAAFPPTCWLLENTVIPSPGAGPSEESQTQGFYDLRFWGQTADDQTIRTQVMGDRDPGYGSTSKILGQAGLCLAKDIPNSGKPGGFWTPAALMGDPLLKRLENYAGLTFNVL